MTHDPIKAKIQELLPDVMELKFGCRFKTPNDLFYVLVGWNSLERVYETFSETTTLTQQFTKLDDYEILGRPITLADVLRAIQSVGERVAISEDGWMWRYKATEKESDIHHIIWNLLKDYDGQTEETKEFIGSLILKV